MGMHKKKTILKRFAHLHSKKKKRRRRRKKKKKIQREKTFMSKMIIAVG